jgi:hypothetical protein
VKRRSCCAGTLGAHSGDISSCFRPAVTSYRSAIFYTSDEQRKIAEDTIADADASHLWPGKVVTEVVPDDFWKPNLSIKIIRWLPSK